MAYPQVAIIGGGPAGMSAAVWLKSCGLRPVIFEPRERLGGLQRVSNYPNPFLLGFLGAPSMTIAERFERHVAKERIPLIRQAVARVSRRGEELVLTAKDGASRSFDALVLAMGTRWATLEIPGARAAERHGRLRTLGHGARMQDASKREVVVVGGGDNAFSAALELSRLARRVVVLSRSAPRAQRLLREQVGSEKNVEVWEGVVPLAIRPGRVRTRGPGSMERDVPAELVFATVGFRPNTERVPQWLPDVQLDAQGYVLVDADCRTSAPRVWAAGDVCNPSHPCTATAVALGTMAGRNIEQTLDLSRAKTDWSLRAAALPSPSVQRVRTAAGSRARSSASRSKAPG